MEVAYFIDVCFFTHLLAGKKDGGNFGGWFVGS
jgi:hypothetical protein